MRIYILGSDSSSKTSYLERAPKHDEDTQKYVRGREWATDAEIISSWSPLSFEIRGPKAKRRICDAYSAFMHHGLSIVVSERARNVFEKFFSGECLFLPVTVSNLDAGFFAVWPRRCLTEALDEAKSTVVLHSYASGTVKSVRCYQFTEERMEGVNWFSLSPYFSGVGLMVSERVESVVKSEGLSGFTFWDKSCEANADKMERLKELQHLPPDGGQ